MNAQQHQQNYAEVYFETTAGETLMESLKIFRLIGETYQVATPVLGGYLLVKRPEQLTLVMTVEMTTIKLIYEPIGQLRLYHGLTDVIGEDVPLENGERADQVKPVSLPPVSASRYYVMTASGISETIQNPLQYQPQQPTQRISIVCLTTAEKQQLDAVEAELTVAPAETASAELFETAQRPMVEVSRVDESNDPISTIQQPERVVKQPVQVTHGNTAKPGMVVNSQSVALIAQALSQIADQIGELGVDPVTNQRQIEQLTTSSNRLLSAIRTLVGENE